MAKRTPAAVAQNPAAITPRRAALELLVLQEQKARPLDQVLAQYPSSRWPVDRRDRQLVRALVIEVLRRRGFLDHVLARYSRHPLAKMKPLTLAALRLGLVQLLFFDRLPPAAAIDETIRALKAARQPRWLTGFVNGLLRNAARDRDTLLHEADNHADLLSIPPWLLQRRQHRLDQDTLRRRCRGDNLPPPLVLRVNRRRTSKAELLERLRGAGVHAEEGRLAPAALVLPDYHGRVEELPGYEQGLFAVQDEAAQLVTMLMADHPAGATEAPLYLDACAGLGGKTAHLAELLPPSARLLALEPHPGRFELLKTNLSRLGIDASLGILPASGAPAAGDSAKSTGRQQKTGAVEIFPHTLEDFSRRFDWASGSAPFQGILMDAPCSGLGVIRRHPDIRWNRQADELPRYQRRQLELLQQAAGLLAPGGILVYVVCSNEPEENEEVMAELLRSNPSLQVDDPRPWLPPAAAGLVDADDFFRSGPEMGLDGFFAARLVALNP